MVQGVPAPVARMDRGFEVAGLVGPVLPGQPAVLAVDQFQLGQSLVDLSLETLRRTGKARRMRMRILELQSAGKKGLNQLFGSGSGCLNCLKL